MSLWLPRTSPTLLVRTHSRSQYARRSLLISSFTVRRVAAGRTRPAGISSTRYQSSKVSPPGQEPAVPSDLTTSSDARPNPPAPKEVPQGTMMSRVWKKVKHEAAHYWHGTKLLVSEVRISSRLQWKILQGDALTRRERRQASRYQNQKLSIDLCLYIPLVVETYNTGFASTHPVRRLHYRPIHGVPSPCGPQTFPEHASLYL